MPWSFLFLHTMGRRQQRIEVDRGSLVWTDYTGKEMQVICANGAVYHGVLKKANDKKIFIKDLSGVEFTLAIETIKEIILDFITKY
ncbi:MAG: hypothetical protein JWO58_1553 [Chitinophagaceae bacterium]|nr:hypothetical protein [Chitinophagaceae bacterium]